MVRVHSQGQSLSLGILYKFSFFIPNLFVPLHSFPLPVDQVSNPLSLSPAVFCFSFRMCKVSQFGTAISSLHLLSLHLSALLSSTLLCSLASRETKRRIEYV